MPFFPTIIHKLVSKVYRWSKKSGKKTVGTKIEVTKGKRKKRESERERARRREIERKRDILRKGERERFVSLTERTSGKVSDDLRA